jgi:hypothetical protein
VSYAPRRSLTTVRDGLNRLIGQFQNRPILAAELSSFLQRLQEIENVLWQIILGRSIVALTSPEGVTTSTAIGVQLDQLGKIVGAPRAGLSDADYLLAIGTQIYVNRSSGVPENFLTIMRRSVPVGTTGQFSELDPACIYVVVLGPDGWNSGLTWRLLRAIKPAGVRLLFVSSPLDPASTFQPCDANNPPGAVTYGYGSTTGGATPGVYASILGV